MNETIFRYLNNFAGQSGLLDSYVLFFAETLGLLMLFGLVIFLFSHEHKKQGLHNIIVVLCAGFFAWFVSEFINYLYISPRPFIALEGANKLMNHGDFDSFPSGHATFFSSIAAVLYFYHKKIAILYALGALFIGVARVVAGIHWPADIIAGYILGGVVAVIFYRVYIHFFK